MARGDGKVMKAAVLAAALTSQAAGERGERAIVTFRTTGSRWVLLGPSEGRYSDRMVSVQSLSDGHRERGDAGEWLLTGETHRGPVRRARWDT